MLVNMTPHPIVVRTDGGDVTIPPSGQVARVTIRQTLAGYIDLDGVQIPVQRTTFGQEVIEIREPITGPEFLKKGVLLDKAQKYPIQAGSYDVKVVRTFTDRSGRPVQVVKLVPHQHQFESVEFVPEREVQGFVMVADHDETEMVETGTHKVPAHWLVKIYDQYGNLLGHGKGPDEATARKRAEAMASVGEE